MSSEGQEHEREYESRGVERLTLFSDAVAAIAITLLAIDLPVPVGSTGPAFWNSVGRNDGHYAAFLISFVVIAAAWGAHHDVFRYVRRTDARLRTLNMVWLLTIVLNPFATRLLTSGPHPSLGVHALRFSFYALLQVIESGALLAMLRHMTARGHLSDAARPSVGGVTRQRYVMMTGFGLSIPFFFVTTYAWLLWIIVPVLAGSLSRLRRRSGRRPGTGEAG